MISLGPAQDALNKLPLPSPDAAYLKQASSLAASGSMFRNPLDDSFSHINDLGFDSHASTLKSIPGAEGLAEQLAGVSEHTNAVKSVSGQMFSSTMPTKAPIPAALVANSNMHPDDLAKVQDFNIPSVTQIMSTASAEQAMHAQLGTSGDNPCLPVQNAMEGTMKSAQAMTAVTKDLSSNGTGAAMASAVSAIKAASDAVNAGVFGAEALLSAAISGASGVINSAVNVVSGALSNMGNSLLGSMKTVRDSTEKSLNVATASMVKNHVQNNPCMKEVLSPGENVWVFDTAFVIKNAGDNLYESAFNLASDALVSITTTLSSLGYVTLEKSTEATEISDTVTERTVSLTLSIDMDKWEEVVGSGDKVLNVIDIDIQNPQTGVPSWVKIKSVFHKLDTDNPEGVSAGSYSESMSIAESPKWRVTKKKGLLTPAMQTMTEPPPKTDTDPIPSGVPPIVQTPSQVVAQKAKAAKAAEPPETIDAPIVIQEAEPVPPAKTAKFTQNLYMRRERFKKEEVWLRVKKNTVEHVCGNGKLKSIITNDGTTLAWIMEFSMSAAEINALIDEYIRKNGSTPMYFQCDISTFKKADDSLSGVQTIMMYFQYVQDSNQVLITSKFKTPDGTTTELLWDTTVFEDPA